MFPLTLRPNKALKAVGILFPFQSSLPSAPPLALLGRDEYRTAPSPGQLNQNEPALPGRRFHRSMNAQNEIELWQTIDKRSEFDASVTRDSTHMASLWRRLRGTNRHACAVGEARPLRFASKLMRFNDIL